MSPNDPLPIFRLRRYCKQFDVLTLRSQRRILYRSVNTYFLAYSDIHLADTLDQGRNSMWDALVQIQCLSVATSSTVCYVCCKRLFIKRARDCCWRSFYLSLQPRAVFVWVTVFSTDFVFSFSGLGSSLRSGPGHKILLL